jgi:hypothetical protein
LNDLVKHEGDDEHEGGARESAAGAGAGSLDDAISWCPIAGHMLFITGMFGRMGKVELRGARSGEDVGRLVKD